MELKYDPDQLIKFWCSRWHIKELPLLEYKKLDGPNGILSTNLKQQSVIVLDEPFRPENEWRVSKVYLLHELRHYYQKKIYRRVYDWWTQMEEEYARYYSTPACVIEEDANIFSWTTGEKNGDVLLRDFNALLLHEELGSMFDHVSQIVTNKRRGILDQYRRKAYELEKKDKLFQWKQIKSGYRYI